jgi:protocatechuate 3,4-dioxygenase beta subunit
MDRIFEPFSDRTQPRSTIEGYPRTWTRTPIEPFIERPPTLTELAGPLRLAEKLLPGDNNLAQLRPGGPRALGQLILLQGRVLDEEGRGIAGALVELWQCNAAGKYIHPIDENDAPVDPNFIGNGRVVTDEEGRFEFTTIKPGAYPVPRSGRWWRPPHVHVSLFGHSFLSRLVTQMYFPGEPLNAQDRLLHSIPDEAARERLIARALDPREAPEGVLAFAHDFVLRGCRATPFES